MLNTVMKPEAAPSVKEKVQRLCALTATPLGDTPSRSTVRFELGSRGAGVALG